MNINQIPDMMQNKTRLAIISSLISGEKDFAQLKELTEATDGNLGSHLLKLEEKEYISVSKSFINRKPKTSYRLTAMGKDNFLQYVNALSDEIKKQTNSLDENNDETNNKL